MFAERLLSSSKTSTQVVGSVQKSDSSSTNRGKRARTKLVNLRNRYETLTSSLGDDILRVDQLGAQFLRFMGLNPSPKVDLLDLLAGIEDDLLGTAVLGTDGSGRPVKLDLSVADMHTVLVAGCEGTGKSSLIRSLMLSIALTSEQKQVQLAIVEPGGGHGRAGNSGSGLHLLSYLPHCIAPLAASLIDVKELLSQIIIEIEDRETVGARDPLLILVIDDIDLLLENGDLEMKKMLIHLLQKGSCGGLRLIIGATSIQDSDMLPLLRLNIPVRLIGQTRNGAHTRLLAGTTSESIRAITMPGRFVALANGHEIPLDAAYIDDYDLHFTATALRRQKSHSLVAKPALPARQPVSKPGNWTQSINP